MRFGIVEGEPGMFPDPVARFLRFLTSPFKRRARNGGSDPSPGKDEADHPDPDAGGPAQQERR